MRSHAVVRSSRKVQASLAAASVLAATQATSAATIVGSVADYEARIEFNNAGNYNEKNNKNVSENGEIGSGNIDAPTDAADLRVGFQARHKMTGAFFFKLPALPAGEQFSSAGLSFTTIRDTATGAAVPTFNADLWAVGVYNGISPDNDADATGKIDTIKDNDGVADGVYLIGDGPKPGEPALSGFNTSVAQRKVSDNFFQPSHWIPNGSTTTNTQRTHTSNSEDPAGLADYLNELYAADPAVAGQYLVVRLNADLLPMKDDGTGTNNQVVDLATRRYQIASGNNGTAAWRPSLTVETATVPEPGTAALAGIAALGLLLRRR